MASDRKRVIFCTYSSIYSSIVLKQLIEDDSIEVVAVINSTRVHHPEYGQLRGAIKQIQLSGWRYSTYLFLITDLFSWAQPVLNYKQGALKTVHGLTSKYQIPTLDTRDINQETVIKFIFEHNPAYILAAHFNQLIKPVLLDLPKIEYINIHPSLLPAYKGVDPVFYALSNDEKELGVSLHRMSESFDSGEILSQKTFIFNPLDSVLSVNKKLFSAGAGLAINWIKDNKKSALANRVKTKENYDSWPTPLQVSQFKKLGKRLANLSELWK